jgi:transposase
LAEKQEQRLALSERERDRLKVLHEVATGSLKQRQGAAQCGMSERGFRKLLKRYREAGDAAVAHGLRGRRSSRRLDEAVAQRAVRESLRKLMIGAGLWRAKPRKMRDVHVWRPRRSCRGELVQWDTSVHAWLEDRGPEKMYLVALIDDATSTLFARFVAADSTEHHMRTLWAYVERFGRPQAVYTDKASLFQPTLAPGWKDEEPGPKTETQLGRALRELGIEWIAAHSPQAKGRIERSFGTLQDRLVKGLRVAGAATIEEANRYLEQTFLPEWNERFVVRPESGLRRSTIRVEARLDGTMQTRIGNGLVELIACDKPARAAGPPKRRAKRYVPGPGESRWMDGFSLKRPCGEMPAASVASGETIACGSKESPPPFPFPPGGKPGRAGSPHAAESAAPPTRGLPPPCASPASTSAAPSSD